ncbi:MAG: succinylglutamate-semialdehyde dehydrogenase [Planctomycetota bacterium]
MDLPIAGKQFIAGKWIEGEGPAWRRHAPSDSSLVWQGNFASAEQMSSAVDAAHAAFQDWAGRKLEERIEFCEKFAQIVGDRKEELAKLIALENGKPLWEARTEVAASIGKVSNSVQSIHQRRWTTTETLGDFKAVTRYRPHGVMLVIGPFNFPSHVPGGHIIPALLAGNTIVFKPSEWVSGVGQWLCEVWEEAGLPEGVLNLVHGTGEVGKVAVESPLVDGVLFTGSQRVGTLLHQTMAGQTHRVLALEMGGNNPLVVHNTSDIRAAAITTILSAFITAGQRCTCSRRLIIVGDETYQALVDELAELIPQIQAGSSLADPQPFMGPLIHAQAAKQMLESEQALIAQGAKSVVSMKQDAECEALLTPALLEMSSPDQVGDCEYFGPLLMTFKAEDFPSAVQMAGSTQYGLSAGFIGDQEEDFEYFIQHIRAGVVNWNRQTTGASGKLPFGGVGISGNHHPSGFHAADYCSFPIASLESAELSEAKKSVPGLGFTNDA